MNNDWNFKIGKNICSFRSVGILIKDGKILIQRDGDEYALPGGHVKVGETAQETLIREFNEETGLTIICKRMIWVDECLWSYNGKDNHEVAFYFLIDTDNIVFSDFTSQKDKCSILFDWVDINEVRNLNIYPEFIKTKITNIGDGIEHFISKG